ncbi:hypothetical protein CH76_08330 [Lysinibacillus sp. BF-4]|uniref:rhodanese-like domain-containing protein n=1 Tax=Lysinibacillus sp. BF-4 TaxID=1473546 RepID=UPI000506442A|nr:rhodanese-like domain-containing protein [Lysinibacillus sp. BF-4]KFL43145.1 hypothetical protein CH76_08330 [Lysinibacillus sp. BF-4]
MYEMTTDEVLAALEAGEELVLIDVREQEEIEAGHMEGIVHIPMGDIPNAVDSLKEHNKKYVIVCRSGSRSGNVTMYLRQFDIDAYNMIGGMLDWRGEVIY